MTFDQLATEGRGLGIWDVWGTIGESGALPAGHKGWGTMRRPDQ